MSKVYILIEQALGYCILNVKHCKCSEDLVSLLQDKDFESVKAKIKLSEFQPFASVNNASLNCQDIANGNANVDLIRLLKRHLSDGRCVLVVSDKKLLESLKAANINELLEFNGDSAMIMLLRRVRFSIHEFMGDNEKHLVRAHIGLGHSFSRMKIKFNVNRADNMIIQSINLMDQLDKDINTMSMRLREWFGYHYPELVKIVTDNRAYSTVVGIIGSRAGAVEDVLERLELVVGDSSRAKQIIVNARTSMGYELTEEDLLNIGYLATKTLSMMNQREDSAKYLASKMAQVAPNFSTLVGDIVAARLISHAGSLINLAKFPASTIQILGAEKALFRALKTRTNTPKYGLIFHSSFIGRAGKNDKGRISRFLAAKISLAVRLDCFMEEPMNIFGLHLKRQVEDQLKFLDTGEEPRKNYEAMEEAVRDAKRYIAEKKLSRDNIDQNNKITEPMADENIEPKSNGIENGGANVELKKHKKKKTSEAVLVSHNSVITSDNVPEESRKKNKNKQSEEVGIVENIEKEVGTISKKKKSKKDKVSNVQEEETIAVIEGKIKKKKRSKSKKDDKEEVTVVTVEQVIVEEVGLESKKKKKKGAVEDSIVEVEEGLVTGVLSKKNKKRSLVDDVSVAKKPKKDKTPKKDETEENIAVKSPTKKKMKSKQ